MQALNVEEISAAAADIFKIDLQLQTFEQLKPAQELGVKMLRWLVLS
jgi:hypothetical protein